MEHRRIADTIIKSTMTKLYDYVVKHNLYYATFLTHRNY